MAKSGSCIQSLMEETRSFRHGDVNVKFQQPNIEIDAMILQAFETCIAVQTKCLNKSEYKDYSV